MGTKLFFVGDDDDWEAIEGEEDVNTYLNSKHFSQQSIEKEYIKVYEVSCRRKIIQSKEPVWKIVEEKKK